MTISLKVSYFRNVLMQKTRKRNTEIPHTIMCNKSGSLFVFFVGCKLKYSFFCKMSFKSCRLECSSNEVFLSEEGYWLQFEKECCNFRIENFMLSFFLSAFSYINIFRHTPYTLHVFLTAFILFVLRAEDQRAFQIFGMENYYIKK